MTDLERIEDLLRKESTLSLATSGADGAPHIAPLFYLSRDNFALYWFSMSDSLHSRHLDSNPAAAVSVYHAAGEWQGVRGVQMRGLAVPVADGSRAAIVEAYKTRFGLGDEFAELIASHELYRFEPAWIRYIDNSLGFGYKFEFTARACPPT